MARTLFTGKFWIDAAERAIKSAAQAATLAFGQDLVSIDVFDADWKTVGGFAIAGTIASIITSIISAPIGDSGTASVV